jgi:hypothetical protein
MGVQKADHSSLETRSETKLLPGSPQALLVDENSTSDDFLVHDESSDSRKVGLSLLLDKGPGRVMTNRRHKRFRFHVQSIMISLMLRQALRRAGWSNE